MSRLALVTHRSIWNWNLKLGFQTWLSSMSVNRQNLNISLNDSNPKLLVYLNWECDNYRPNVPDIAKSVKTFQRNELALRLSLKWSEQIRCPTLPLVAPSIEWNWGMLTPHKRTVDWCWPPGDRLAPKLFRLWEIVKENLPKYVHIRYWQPAIASRGNFKKVSQQEVVACHLLFGRTANVFVSLNRLLRGSGAS